METIRRPDVNVPADLVRVEIVVEIEEKKRDLALRQSLRQC